MDDLKEAVLLYDLPRSGGVYVWQALTRLFGNENVKFVHEFIKTNKPVVVCYRDFRDVLISHWRIYYAKYDYQGEITNQPTLEELKCILNTVKNRIQILNNYRDYYKDGKALFLQYEPRYENYEYLFKQLESFFNITIPFYKKNEIINYSNIDLNIKRSEKIPIILKTKEFDNEDWDTGIARRHIYKKGLPGNWKENIPKELHDYVNNELKIELSNWGYEI